MVIMARERLVHCLLLVHKRYTGTGGTTYKCVTIMEIKFNQSQ